MKKAVIVKTSAHESRTAYMSIKDDLVEFDTSDGEYGPASVTLQQIKEAINKYEEINGKNRSEDS